MIYPNSIPQLACSNYWLWLRQLLRHEKLEWLHGAISSNDCYYYGCTPRDLILTTQTFFATDRDLILTTQTFSQPLEISFLLHKLFVQHCLLHCLQHCDSSRHSMPNLWESLSSREAPYLNHYTHPPGCDSCCSVHKYFST